jgi:hypothetical protein
MKLNRRAPYALWGVLILGIAAGGAQAQTIAAPVAATQLIGLTGVKNNAKGKLKVENGQLQFAHGKESGAVATTAIEDVVTGADTQRMVGGTLGTLSMAAPYGSGRFLSLFRKKIDTLTLQYRDADGGLHGVIFTLPAGASEVLKKELIAQGAHTSIRAEANAAPATTPTKELN